MDIYNTVVTVVANLEAESEDAAITALSGSLIDHGFDTITDPGGPPAYAHAFVAEEGTEPHTLPEPGRLPPRVRRAPLGPLASRFTADEIEALIITAGDLWNAYSDEDQILSARQKTLAQRAFDLAEARMESQQ
jgi:hypothetical protein